MGGGDAHGGPWGTAGAPGVSFESVARGPHQQGRTHKDRPLGAGSVLGGARGLRDSGLLVWGRGGPHGRCGWQGGAGERVEAVGVDGRDEGERLHTQRVGRVLAQQGDGGLQGGGEAGGQADCLHLGAPREALAGPGARFHFVDNHQLVRKVRLRLLQSHGVI